jgi:translocation and assembly module TamA
MRFFVLLLLPIALFAGKIDYTVHFIGIDDRPTLQSLKAVSDLSTLQDKPPASINALRYRADSDIPELIKVLHAHGYYEATVNIRIEGTEGDTAVYIMVQPGPVYTIEEFSINLHPHPCIVKNAGIKIGAPALAKDILEAQQTILAGLSDCGLPLAHIEKQELVVDGKTKTMRISLDIETGPYCLFGSSEMRGLVTTKQKLIERKTAWKTGDPYASSLVEKTQKKLLDTGLFSSVLITHDSVPGAKNELPMKIEVNENKHRSINIGASYQTFFGPGLTFGWEDRNISGLGRRLSLQGDITRKTHSGVATFLVPDFFRIEQDYVAQAQAIHESIFAYVDRSYTLTNRVERRIGTKYRVSIGVKLERMIVGESVSNGTFTLLEIPLYFRWSSANHLLNPTKGATLEYKIIPSGNFSQPDRYYLDQSVAYAFYWPVTTSDFFVIAQQVMLETIWSKTLRAIPVPKRVLGGTEQDLRGYRYRTVSPLDGHHPIGGRSGIFYTLETRFHITKSFGLVPFFDLGNVDSTALPNFKREWFKSAGLGVRYFTFLGPLRFDIAFPLDQRKGIDPRYRIIVSIGQTF